MAQIGNVALCGATMIVVWTLIGLPIATRVANRELSWFLAPALGWSVFSAATLPFFSIVGMSRFNVGVTLLAIVALSIVTLWKRRDLIDSSAMSRLVIIGIAGAALLALLPTAAILPKETADGIRLADPIFDHSKIAMIDEMVRAGVPPLNPFFNEIGAPQRLSYYYLWHYSAAVVAVLSGMNGWEADAALTWFTAFSSLLVVIGFAIWFSGRAVAAIFVVAIAATASLRSIVEWLVGEEPTFAVVRWATGLGAWLSQVSWAPQHMASAMAVVLACYLIAQLPNRRDYLLIVTLSLVVVAGLQSSVWAGGFAFIIAATAIGLKLLWELLPPVRGKFLVSALTAALVTIALAASFLYDQVTITGSRDGEWPITVSQLPVVGDAFPASVRRIIDLPAYWLIYLPVEFPAFYPAGVFALFLMLRDRVPGPDRRQIIQAFALLVAASLVCCWLLVGDLGGNNDLAWRSILPAVLLLICFAAAGLAQWTATRRRTLICLAILGLLLGLPGAISFAKRNVVGWPSTAEAGFAKSPTLWEAVRRHSGINERVANNPFFLGAITPWPVNMSWAVLSNRRSCYAGFNLAIPFAPVSAARRRTVEDQFARVFTGNSASDDVQQLAERHGCDIAVVTADDGAWANDPFAASRYYRLMESRSSEWRIYRKFEP